MTRKNGRWNSSVWNKKKSSLLDSREKQYLVSDDLPDELAAFGGRNSHRFLSVGISASAAAMPFRKTIGAFRKACDVDFLKFDNPRFIELESGLSHGPKIVTSGKIIGIVERYRARRNRSIRGDGKIRRRNSARILRYRVDVRSGKRNVDSKATVFFPSPNVLFAQGFVVEIFSRRSLSETVFQCDEKVLYPKSFINFVHHRADDSGIFFGGDHGDVHG